MEEAVNKVGEHGEGSTWEGGSWGRGYLEKKSLRTESWGGRLHQKEGI